MTDLNRLRKLAGLPELKTTMITESTEENNEVTEQAVTEEPELLSKTKRVVESLVFENANVLDQMISGYIRAIDFTGDAFDNEEEERDVEYSEEALASIRDICTRFYNENQADIEELIYEIGFSAESVGIDLYLTSVGHGSGFWDRAEIPDEMGKRLTKGSKKFETQPYIGDDGKLYL